ncbi:hypothetical protein VNO77_07936 [Canavalia gladiata]|uniref:Uncharacterized protein n=1 Tax=Canavalia gladiata TaxID=3824 RepID=A0AAN9M815_CANGL
MASHNGVDLLISYLMPQRRGKKANLDDTRIATTRAIPFASDLTTAHSYCERPRNRDASREAYDVDAPNPASGVASEVAAALAFSSEHSAYLNLLIQRFRYEMQRPSDLPVTARGSGNRQWHRLEESSWPPYTHRS